MLAFRQCHRQGQAADTPDVHEENDDIPGIAVQFPRHAQGQPDCADGGKNFEKHLLEREILAQKDEHHPRYHQHQIDRDGAERAPDQAVLQPAAVDIQVVAATGIGDDRQEDHQEGRCLDAPAR